MCACLCWMKSGFRIDSVSVTRCGFDGATTLLSESFIFHDACQLAFGNSLAPLSVHHSKRRAQSRRVSSLLLLRLLWFRPFSLHSEALDHLRLPYLLTCWSVLGGDSTQGIHIPYMWKIEGWLNLVLYHQHVPCVFFSLVWLLLLEPSD